MTSRKTEALHELAREKHDRQRSTTRRQLIRASALAGAGALSAALFGSPAAAAPAGTLPVPSDAAFIKFRGNRLRLVERSSAPAAPSSGRVVFYTDGSDL